MSSTEICIIKSFSDASTSSGASVPSDSDVLRRFLTILSLLSALSAEALDTGRQQKILYSIWRFGNPESWADSCSGFTKLFFDHRIFSAVHPSSSFSCELSDCDWLDACSDNGSGWLATVFVRSSVPHTKQNKTIYNVMHAQVITYIF